MSDRLFLVDGSAQIYRAYFAFAKSSLRTKSGEPTSAIFGFLLMLFTLLEKDPKPTHLVLAFDRPEPTFRHNLYEEYKATREKMPDDLVAQLPRLRQVLQAMNLAIVEKPGWEADDIIGTLAKTARRKGFEVYLVSGDKDFQQLVQDGVMIYDTKKEGTQILDEKGVEEKFGVPPEKVCDVLGLMGDTSDNVPGVSGVGPKTAVSLVKTYGSLEAALKHAHEISKPSVREALLRDHDQALLSKRLVTIDTGAPVEFSAEAFRLKPFDSPEVEQLLRDLEFLSLLKYLPSKPKRKAKAERDYRAVLEVEALQKLLATWQEEKRMVSIDLETTSIDPMQAELVGASFAADEGEAFFVPLSEFHGKPAHLRQFRRFGKSVEPHVSAFLTIAAPFYEDETVPKAGQNLKYDALVLRCYGIEVKNIAFDTLLAASLLDPGAKQLSLDVLSQKYLQLSKIPTEALIGKGKKQRSMFEVETSELTEYASEDADYALRLTHILGNLLIREKLDALLHDLELPLLPVLLEMEFTGVSLDVNLLRELSKELERDLARLEEQCYALAGSRFNLNSPKQLAEVLFEKLKLPVQHRTKSGPSTDVATLTHLATLHDLPARLLDYRSLAKLKSTYMETLLTLVHPDTGRVHTTFGQTATATGRLSSANPNLQNIPIRSPMGRRIREAFVPGKKDWVICSADYSQIELRIMAHLSGDERLRTAFEKGGDVHRETAALIYGISPKDVLPEMRRAAKTVNFGIIYGQTDFGLAEELGIPRHEAHAFRERYFQLYPGVKRFIEQTIRECQEAGFVTTLLGRKRAIPDINASDRQVREFAERTAVNTPVQGTAADMIKLAMVRVARKLHAQKLEAAMILQVHDELVFEAPEKEVQALEQLVTREMRDALPLSVPIVVEFGYGKNWLESHG
jgi:DNA polymerase-1